MSNFTKAWEKLTAILPTENDWAEDANGVDIWYYAIADEILCRTEKLADAIADILDAISGEHESLTGYYDPEQDERDNCVDDRTGWWYVDYD